MRTQHGDWSHRYEKSKPGEPPQAGGACAGRVRRRGTIVLTPEENERITRVGPGTPMGETLRRYWHPVLLSHELAEPDGPPLRVRILGEDLIAFRDTEGKVGLVDAFCPHRRAP